MYPALANHICSYISSKCTSSFHFALFLFLYCPHTANHNSHDHFTKHFTSHKAIVHKIYIINVCEELLEPSRKDAFEEERIVDSIMSWISYPYQDSF